MPGEEIVMTRKGIEDNMGQENVYSKAFSGQCVIVIDCWVSLCAQKSGKKGFTMQKGGISQSREVLLQTHKRKEKWSFEENGLAGPTWSKAVLETRQCHLHCCWASFWAEKSGKKDLRCKKSITLHYSLLHFILNITIPWKEKGNGKKDKKA